MVGHPDRAVAIVLRVMNQLVAATWSHRPGCWDGRRSSETPSATPWAQPECARSSVPRNGGTCNAKLRAGGREHDHRHHDAHDFQRREPQPSPRPCDREHPTATPLACPLGVERRRRARNEPRAIPVRPAPQSRGIVTITLFHSCSRRVTPTTASDEPHQSRSASLRAPGSRHRAAAVCRVRRW